MNELNEQIYDLLTNYGIDQFVYATIEAAKDLEKAHQVERHQESCRLFAAALAKLQEYNH